jgi:protocatechuate 3,4-dioxygenase beta subunit
MKTTASLSGRRAFLGSMAFSAAWFTTRGLFAEELMRTPAQTEGPFYPDKLPLDTDNDLLIINDKITPAVGEITHLTGRVLDARGEPVRNAVVEIWQVDGRGVYLHRQSEGGERRDANFQGFGRFLTGSKGEYYFRTVKPVPYPVRPAPHIHVMIKKGDKELLTTQLYIKGHAGNERDFIYQGIDKNARGAVTVDFAPVKDSKIGELAAHFDVVLGSTAPG